MKEHTKKIVKILTESYTLDQAKLRIEKELGREPTSDSLCSLFRRQGLGAPSKHLRPPTAPLPVANDDDDPPTLEGLVPTGLSRIEGVSRIFKIPDTHVPAHSEEAFDLAIEAGKEFAPDIVTIMGDFVDFESVSGHDPLPGEARPCLADELAAAKECLGRVTNEIPTKRRVYIAGNHEYRLEKYMLKHASALVGMPGLSIREALGLDELGWEYIPYKQGLQIGDLFITHDLERAGISAVRQSRIALGRSVAIGHVHRTGLEFENTADGQPWHAASFGWLGDPERVNYRHRTLARREWTHGVGLGYLDEGGHVHMVPCPFVNGRAVVEGKIVTARRYAEAA